MRPAQGPLAHPSPRKELLHLRRIQRPVQHQPPVLCLYRLAQERALHALHGRRDHGAREKMQAAQRGCEGEEVAVVGVDGGADVAQDAAAVEEKTDGVGTKVDDWHGD